MMRWQKKVALALGDDATLRQQYCVVAKVPPMNVLFHLPHNTNTIMSQTMDNTQAAGATQHETINKCLSDAIQVTKTINENLKFLTTMIGVFEKYKDQAPERENHSQKLQDMRDDFDTLSAWKTEIENLEYIITTTFHPDVTNESDIASTRKAIDSSPELKSRDF